MRSIPDPRGALRRTCGTALILTLALGIPSGAEAQYASVGYERQSWGYEELPGLAGFSLGVDWPSGVGLYFDLGLATWNATGLSCSGFVADPSDCVSELHGYSASTFAMGARWAIGQWEVPGGHTSLVPFVGYAAVNLEREGPEGQRRGSDATLQLEGGVAVRYRTLPWLFNRVGLFVEARASGGAALPNGCEDCYDPLRGGSPRASFLAGITVGG